MVYRTVLSMHVSLSERRFHLRQTGGLTQVSLITLIMGALLLCTGAQVVASTSEEKSTTVGPVHKRSRPQ